MVLDFNQLSFDYLIMIMNFKLPVFIIFEVLVKQNKTNKSVSVFDPVPCGIINIKGTMITASRLDHCINRNISLFKKYIVQVSLSFDVPCNS
ncbi:hypothetical protein BpHYR1_007729 [Brachionus plicatilis]|uniref:Uncharacterized protein n=1 Tax=Brachionus plicatilis TaxID=10195 RepID=A0A3M7Q502_BRAPC|nr:hypothetical protein BpHYR1_007729 [Brachionus plicatilis]